MAVGVSGGTAVRLGEGFELVGDAEVELAARQRIEAEPAPVRRLEVGDRAALAQQPVGGRPRSR